ncbi:MAG: SH3 domain-containing protein [Clostridiaceae bacterium]
MHKETIDIDALLYEAAKRDTAKADLGGILKRLREAEAPAKKPLPRLRFAAIAAAAAVFVLIFAAFTHARTVEVNGKTFLALQNKVSIGGVTRKLGAADENGLLLQFGNTNQYVDLTETETSPRVFVFAPGASPEALKNPDAIPGKSGVPESLAPVTVFPVVNDLVVREGPDTAYAAIGELYSGQCVQKVGVCGNWAILGWDGGLAYAFNAYLFEAPEVVPAYTPVSMCATEPVNVRALPTSRDFSAVLYELQTGEQVICTGSIGEWTEIAWNGQKAYVFTKYLREGGNIE